MGPTIEQDPLDLDGGWRLGEAAFDRIVGLIEQSGASRILEFGSGASTVRLARAVPRARILSVEHDASYHEQTLRLARAHQLGERLRVRLCPLRFWRFHGRLFYTYDFEPPDEPFDFVLIDGPPGYLITGRQACLHKCFPLLRVGATVVLDDFREPRERRTLRRWLATYPGALSPSVLDVDHTLLVLRKIREVPAARAGARETARNVGDNLVSAFLRGRHLAGRVLPRRNRASNTSALTRP